jgi:threonine dehydratase
LISGIGTVIKARAPHVQMVGVEPEHAACLAAALERHAPTTVKLQPTLADGLAVASVGERSLDVARKVVDRVVTVDEASIALAILRLVELEKSVVEGAGAAGLAAMLAEPERFKGKKVGTILCGGNIDTHLLANVLVRELVRCGRIARLRINAQDRPGALAAITAKFHECGVNIIETNHHRIFTRLPAKDTVIEVECEARDAQAIDTLVKRLEGAGFHVERAELD